MENEWRYAVAANIKESRVDENGILRYGTPAFRGHTKVYLCGRLWDEQLPDENKREISVLGLRRRGRYYVDQIPIAMLEHLRLTRVYKPAVLEIMSNFEFHPCWWGNTPEERADAAAFLKRLKEKYQVE